MTHRNAVTTAVKRTLKMIDCDGSEREELLTKNLERKVTLCLLNSFCRNVETNLNPLPCWKQRVKKKRCWRTASNRARMATYVVQDTETEITESMSQEEDMEQ